LYWQVGDEVVELRQLKLRFFAAHLLARTLGFNSKPLPPVAGLNKLDSLPAAQVSAPPPGQSIATVQLTDHGGGIGRVVVKVNGSEVPFALRGAPKADALIAIDLKQAKLTASGENKIEVIPYDKDLNAGRGIITTWKQAPKNAAAPAVLHAIIVGVSEYESTSMSLTFPAKDAVDMAHAVEVGGRSMFGVDRIDIATFASGTALESTKANIHHAFETVAAKAGPSDVVLVYFAGHGVAGMKDGSEIYYYPTRDARTLKPEDDPQLWAQTTINSEELFEWLRVLPLRRVLVLDTCAAGAADTALLHLSDPREIHDEDQIKAIELLKDSTGSHILMGAAADKVSYEASRYGHGLLTYSLLLGIHDTTALDEGGRLDVVNWFRRAKLSVLDLAKGLDYVQEPVIRSGGQPFPIALFTPEDRAQIHLPSLKPQLLRARVEDEDQNDPLQLDRLVREALRAASLPATRGETRSEPLLVYLDGVAGDVADAYVPQVRYMVKGSTVQIRLRLVSDHNRPEREFEAATREPAELSKRIVEEFLSMLVSIQPK
jgi:hypothetical protein